MNNNESTPEERKSAKMREIITAGAEQAAWLPLPEKFFSGDETGFDFAGVNVMAKILFDIGKLTVEMTSPVNCTASKVIYGHRSFFNRTGAFGPFCEDGKEGGPATAYCVETAKELLVNLFSEIGRASCRERV